MREKIKMCKKNEIKIDSKKKCRRVKRTNWIERVVKF